MNGCQGTPWSEELDGKELPEPNVYEITLMEDNERAKTMAENPLSSGRSKHIDVRWHFIHELVEKKELKVVQVASEWQHANIPLKKRCM